MRYDAVLFDFSGTLFGRADGYAWLFPEGETDESIQRAVVDALRFPGRQLGSMTGAERECWEFRDLSDEANRQAYRALFRIAGLECEALFDTVFDRLTDERHWAAYADTRPTLEHLSRAGLPVGVLSNITWDIRRAFGREELTPLVDDFVLSYEVGCCKPEPDIFRTACERLAVPPKRCLLLGDDEVTDGGAVRAGLGFAHVATGPVGRRPPVLMAALAQHGL
ncbi:HAD family hydrolase [Streptomyces canus]|uniref:HAD family hydrolase n=1 Tax=Streptomyces canus TaxID=58343 RepID=UPI002E25713F